VRQGTPDEYFSNKSELGLNPNASATRQGRCNRQGAQAMYFATTETTALYEACEERRLERSDFHLAYISRWHNRVPLRLAKFLDVTGPFRDRHVRNHHSKDMMLMATLHPDRISLIRKFLHLIGRSFVTRAGEASVAYEITNAVAESVFRRFDGIYYSSSMGKAHGTNIAVRPGRMEDYFSFYCVARVLYAPADSSGQEFLPLTNALGTVRGDSGTLSWRENMGILPSSLPLWFIRQNYQVPQRSPINRCINFRPTRR
jgi:hypothetical protein